MPADYMNDIRIPNDWRNHRIACIVHSNWYRIVNKWLWQLLSSTSLFECSFFFIDGPARFIYIFADWSIALNNEHQSNNETIKYCNMVEASIYNNANTRTVNTIQSQMFAIGWLIERSSNYQIYAHTIQQHIHTRNRCFYFLFGHKLRHTVIFEYKLLSSELNSFQKSYNNAIVHCPSDMSGCFTDD